MVIITVFVVMVVMYVLLIAFVAAVGLNIMAVVASTILPYAVSMLLASVLISLLAALTKSEGLLKIRPWASVILGLAAFLLFTYLPRRPYHFDMDDVAYVVYYDMETGEPTDLIEDSGRVAEYLELLEGMKVHYNYSNYIPRGLRAEINSFVHSYSKTTRYLIGLSDREHNRLAAIALSDERMFCVMNEDDGKVRWYNLYHPADLNALEKIHRQEQRADTEVRVTADNGAEAERCFGTLTYQDGELSLTLGNFVYEDSLEVYAHAVIRNEEYSDRFRDIYPLKDAELPEAYENGQTVRIPVPQDKLYRDFTVGVVLDGISILHDAVELLPDELRLPD